MDIGVAALSRTLSLDEDSRPAELKSCHPWGECKFSLQMRRGGLVRIHDSVLMAESRYKCLLISEHTTVREVVTILFHCYGLERIERVDRYVLCEVSENDFERRLHPEDCPALIQQSWDDSNTFQFVLKRNNVLSLSVNSASPSSNSVTGMSPTSDCSSSTSSSIEEPMDIPMDMSYSTNSSDFNSSPSPSPDVFQQVLTSSTLSKTTKVVSAVSIPMLSSASTSETVAASDSTLSKAMTSSSSSKLPKFNIHGPVTLKSFHEVGLPPVLRSKQAKQQASLLLANGSRGNIISRHLRSKLPDYENYFYI
jgi:hypothetical protein